LLVSKIKMQKSIYLKYSITNIKVLGSVLIILIFIGILNNTQSFIFPIILSYMSSGFVFFTSLNKVLCEMNYLRKTKNKTNLPYYKICYNVLWVQLLIIFVVFLILSLYSHSIGFIFIACNLSLIIVNFFYNFLIQYFIQLQTKYKIIHYYTYISIGLVLSLIVCITFGFLYEIKIISFLL